MGLVVTLLLMGLSAYAGAMTALRWREGQHEAELQRLEEDRYRRGRRGTVRLTPLRIRR